jgi:integrase/recombinase XerC
MAYVKNAVRSPPRSMSSSEQAKVLKVTGEHVHGFRDHVMISMALGTALRESELAALNVGDVLTLHRDVRTQIELQVYARKGQIDTATGRRRPVPQRVFIPKSARAKLQKFIEWKKKRRQGIGAADPLFLSEKGRRIADRTMRHIWQRWQERAGIETPYTFHELRHTALTNLYAATQDILLVQKQARHASVTSTQIYAHVSDSQSRAAIEDMPC